jgi:hypothetical protein
VIFYHVSTESTTKSLWMKLHDLYERKTAVNKIFLIRQLVNMKFKEGSLVAKHLNEMQNVVNQLASMKMSLSDELQAILLLHSLPESYETLVVSLSNSAPDGVLTMSHVTSSLMNEEVRKKIINFSTLQILSNEDRGRSHHRESHGRGNSKPRSKSRSKVICHYCGGTEHFKKHCRKFKRDNKEGKPKEK